MITTKSDVGDVFISWLVNRLWLCGLKKHIIHYVEGETNFVCHHSFCTSRMRWRGTQDMTPFSLQVVAAVAPAVVAVRVTPIVVTTHSRCSTYATHLAGSNSCENGLISRQNNGKTSSSTCSARIGAVERILGQTTIDRADLWPAVPHWMTYKNTISLVQVSILWISNCKRY